VLLFSLWYFNCEQYSWKFHSILQAFCLNAWVFVESEDIYLTLLVWESISWLSYGLIHYWGVRPESIRAAVKSAWINRAADTVV
jgi:NADH:ubiquinone oxidoreductase subunit 5 (subunit L)/multisubunit Na+/H+ antiporter MnhA subunit